MARVLSWPFDRFRQVMRFGYEPSVPVLSATRIAFALYLLFWGLIPVAWLSALPQQFFDPPAGPAQLARSFPSEVVGLGLDVAGVVLVLLVGIGWRTRTTSYLLFFWAVITSSIIFSLGKVDHTFITWLMVPLFGSAGWGDMYSVDAWRNPDRPTRPSWPVPALAFMIAFGFLTAAAPKLGRGWLSPSSQAVEGYFRSFFTSHGRDGLLAESFFLIESSLFWESLDVWTVLFELAVGIAVLWPRRFRQMLLLASIFHVTVVFIMNISFIPMMFAYIPILASGRSIRSPSPADPNRVWFAPAIGGAFVILGGLALTGTPARLRLASLLSIDELVITAILGTAVLAPILWLTMPRATHALIPAFKLRRDMTDPAKMAAKGETP